MLSEIRKKIKSAHPDHIHHQPHKFGSTVLGEIVFGSEDGMVSTLGAITGIAAASQNHFFIVLSGLVIISVESISMAVGSYLSSKSEKEMSDRILKEEAHEIQSIPDIEEKELIEMYKEDGWPVELSNEMAKAARQKPDLFLKEMAYRELRVIPNEGAEPFKNGLAMGVSYVIGGVIPLFPYFLIESTVYSIGTSIFITLVGLFALGSYTTKFTKRTWWKAGFEMFALATVAAAVGFLVGQIANRFLV
jgi:VIT1/CCC1 family predicted Fe2+/Mn2+ transporter